MHHVPADGAFEAIEVVLDWPTTAEEALVLTTALDWSRDWLMDVKFDEATEVALDDGRGTAVACETADEAIEPTDGRIVLCEADRDTLDGMFLTKSEYSP